MNLSVTAHPRPGFNYKFRSRIVNSGIEPIAGILTVNYDPALFIDTNYTYSVILDSLNHTVIIIDLMNLYGLIQL